MDEIWIPIVAMIAPAVVIALAFWLRHKNRESMQQTFRAALDKGQELTPEIVDRLGTPKPKKDKDLRLGVIWLAIAIAFGCFALVIPDDEGTTVMLGLSAFPFCLGFGYLILHKFADHD